MSNFKRTLFAFIPAVLLGCPGASGADPAKVAPAAADWLLESGRDIPKRPPRTPKLRTENGKLSGSTGCNAFSAAVIDKADKRIAIEQVALTRKLCAEKLDSIETAFVRALEETQFLERQGKRLVFLSGTRQALLVWAPPQKAARAVKRGRYVVRARHPRRHIRVRQVRRTSAVVYRGCWGSIGGIPVRRGRRL